MCNYNNIIIKINSYLMNATAPPISPGLLQAVPYFAVLIAIEALVRWLQSKPFPRINDSINSVTAGVMMQLCRLVIGAFEVTSYAWIYEKCRLADLPWDSPLTWWLGFLGLDFFYYWFHRMAHGVLIFLSHTLTHTHTHSSCYPYRGKSVLGHPSSPPQF